MLDQIQHRAIELLQQVSRVVLVTDGPAGLLAQWFPAEANGLALYLAVPGTSDHLYNLESNTSLMIVTEAWEIKGSGRIVDIGDLPARPCLTKAPQAPWCSIVEVKPARLQRRHGDSGQIVETIDFESEEVI